MAMDEKKWGLHTQELPKSSCLSMLSSLWLLMHSILPLSMKHALMFATFFGTMKHGAIKMKRNLSFGQMARLAAAVYDKAKAKVNN
jgi:hypothetical protein